MTVLQSEFRVATAERLRGLVKSRTMRFASFYGARMRRLCLWSFESYATQSYYVMLTVSGFTTVKRPNGLWQKLICVHMTTEVFNATQTVGLILVLSHSP